MLCKEHGLESWNIEKSEGLNTIEIQLARWHQIRVLEDTKRIYQCLKFSFVFGS